MSWWSNGDWLDKVFIRYGLRKGQSVFDALNDHYRAVFDSNSGRIVLADLVREAGLLATKEGLPADQVMFQAGKMHMATHLLARLNFIEPQLQQIAHLTAVEPSED